jgi:hypothetical protein
VQEELIALQTEIGFLVTKAIFVLHNWLRQNSADRLTYITDGLAIIEE